jgi:hypothetical protein
MVELLSQFLADDPSSCTGIVGGVELITKSSSGMMVIDV